VDSKGEGTVLDQHINFSLVDSVRWSIDCLAQPAAGLPC